MPRIIWRFALPILQGAIAVTLMIWQHSNERVIASMGMAWDTGAPIWPFETPQIVLTVFNFPAYVIAIPISQALRLPTTDWRNLICLPAIWLLWYGVGRQIDFGLVPEKCVRRGGWLPVSLLVLATMALLAGLYCLRDGVRWWSQYGGISVSQFLILMRLIIPLPWCLLLAWLCLSVSIQVLRLRVKPQ